MPAGGRQQAEHGGPSTSVSGNLHGAMTGVAVRDHLRRRSHDVRLRPSLRAGSHSVGHTRLWHDCCRLPHCQDGSRPGARPGDRLTCAISAPSPVCPRHSPVLTGPSGTNLARVTVGRPGPRARPRVRVLHPAAAFAGLAGRSRLVLCAPPSEARRAAIDRRAVRPVLGYLPVISKQRTVSVKREVGMRRGVSVAAGPFPHAASRTRRAPQSAPGSPQAPQGRWLPHVVLGHGVGMRVPR
jgi:hypothetical protein